jgi:hypothetical protein
MRRKPRAARAPTYLPGDAVTVVAHFASSLPTGCKLKAYFGILTDQHDASESPTETMDADRPAWIVLTKSRKIARDAVAISGTIPYVTPGDYHIHRLDCCCSGSTQQLPLPSGGLSLQVAARSLPEIPRLDALTALRIQ